jgi:two-component system, response regulator PdtaR
MLKARRDGQPTRLSSTSIAPVRRTFWLLAIPASSPPGGPSSSPGSGGGGKPVRRRILVVEDDWLIAAQIESCLDAAGFDVTGAAVGPQDALRLVRATPPQLVLMDIRLLDDADGVELAKKLWQDFGLRCLFVSGNIDADTELRAAAAQPLGWLSKPFTEAELLQAVADAFDGLS